MNYAETIRTLANNLLVNFDEIYYNAEMVVNDKGERHPAIALKNEYLPLSPTDQREVIYIRRNGDDEVLSEERLGSCITSYKMRSHLRIVYFKDNCKEHEKVVHNLMQSVLIGNTKLNKIIRDKFKLKKEESSGEYNFGASTAYYAIDIYIHWNLQPDTCEQDFCIEGENPLKKNC